MSFTHMFIFLQIKFIFAPGILLKKRRAERDMHSTVKVTARSSGILKEPLKGSRISFCGRGSNSPSSLYRMRILTKSRVLLYLFPTKYPKRYQDNFNVGRWCYLNTLAGTTELTITPVTFPGLPAPDPPTSPHPISHHKYFQLVIYLRGFRFLILIN